MMGEYIQAEDVQVTLFGMLDAAASQKGGALSAEEKETVKSNDRKLRARKGAKPVNVEAEAPAAE